MAKTIGAAEFKATCLRVIKQMGRDGEPVTITNRGRPVAVLSPAPAPIEPAIAIDSVRLPGSFHADPADRFIIATAYAAGGHVRVIDASR